MKLEIDNIAKISHAEIQFDGLTVISGENNTGKSTAGKVLYSVFRSLSQMARRVERDRVQTVQKAINRTPGVHVEEDVAKQVLLGVRKIDEILPASVDSFYKERVNVALGTAKNTQYNDVAAYLVKRVFDCVFHGQILPLQSYKGESKVVLKIREQENTIQFFEGGSINTLNPTSLAKIVRLIATPEVLSLVNIRDISEPERYTKVFDKYTLELAQELVKDSHLSAVEEVATRQQLNEVMPLLDGFIKGVFRPDEDGEFALYEAGHSKPTKAGNISMGLKFFVLLRFMLEKGVLSEKDILILDEPENHLHPEMQVVYAQVLVLLQKKFDLTVLVTSHSQFFVNALQRFCISEGIGEKTHFYISKEDESQKGFYTFEDRGMVASDIFRSFNKAYDLISTRSHEEWQDRENA